MEEYLAAKRRVNYLREQIENLVHGQLYESAEMLCSLLMYKTQEMALHSQPYELADEDNFGFSVSQCHVLIIELFVKVLQVNGEYLRAQFFKDQIKDLKLSASNCSGTVPAISSMGTTESAAASSHFFEQDSAPCSATQGTTPKQPDTALYTSPPPPVVQRRAAGGGLIRRRFSGAGGVEEGVDTAMIGVGKEAKVAPATRRRGESACAAWQAVATLPHHEQEVAAQRSLAEQLSIYGPTNAKELDAATNVTLGHLCKTAGDLTSATVHFKTALQQQPFAIEACLGLVEVGKTEQEIMGIMGQCLARATAAHSPSLTSSAYSPREELEWLSKFVEALARDHTNDVDGAAAAWAALGGAGSPGAAAAGAAGRGPFFPGAPLALREAGRLRLAQERPGEAARLFALAGAADEHWLHLAGHHAAALRQARPPGELASLCQSLLATVTAMPEDWCDEAADDIWGTPRERAGPWAALALLAERGGDRARALKHAGRAAAAALAGAAAAGRRLGCTAEYVLARELEGSLALALGAPARAARAFRLALRARPGFIAFKGLTEAHLASSGPGGGGGGPSSQRAPGAAKAALVAAKGALELLPRHPRALALVGRVLLKSAPSLESGPRGQQAAATYTTKARKAFAKALALDPKSGEAARALADLALRGGADGGGGGGGPGEAEDLLQKSLAFQNSEGAHAQLGDVYVETHKFMLALEHYHTAISINRHSSAADGLDRLEIVLKNSDHSYSDVMEDKEGAGFQNFSGEDRSA